MINTVFLSQGYPLTIDDIAQEIGFADQGLLRVKIERSAQNHYQLFGKMPFIIIYDPNLSSYVVQASNCIGRIDCGGFVLEIRPKFRNIELGKCLHLAHLCGSEKLVRHTNTFCDAQVNDKEKLESIDYFAYGLLGNVIDCINSGLITEFSKITKSDSMLRGKINIGKTVSSAKINTEPYTDSTIRTERCNINAILKTAVHYVRNYASSNNVRALAESILTQLKAVDILEDINFASLSIPSTLPRPDYDRAIKLARIVIEGFSPVIGKEGSFLPFYSIDMDRLFEEYCAYQIKKLLKDEYFDIQIQRKFDHPITPNISRKGIIPDIVIQPKKDRGIPIVIDTKNKYSISVDGDARVYNQDLFQIIYYARVIGAKTVVLLYPGDNETASSYPLRGSLGEEAYRKKRNSHIRDMEQSGKDIFKFCADSCTIKIVTWRIDLSGTIYNTISSFAQFSQFLSDESFNEITT